MAIESTGKFLSNHYLALGAHVKTHRLGHVYPADTTYILSEDEQGVQLMRLPDVSFVATNRVKTENRQTYYHLAPDLAIEIISPLERAVDIRTKLRDYLHSGVRQVWQIYPETQEVMVYLPDGTVRTYEVGQSVPGDDIFPGFNLPVENIFEA